METSIWLGLILGMVIGSAFAWLQMLALRRNEMLEKQQQLPGLFKLIPGSMGRVAFLLMALVLVQVLFPGVNLWWLTGGLVVTYAIPFIWQMKNRFSRVL
jgi:hypothetical protein